MIGSMVSKLVVSPTYKWGIPWDYTPLVRSPFFLLVGIPEKGVNWVL